MSRESLAQTPIRDNRLQLSGTFELAIDGKEVPLPLCGQRLLAYLALARRSVSRNRCAGELWEHETQARANSNLRTVLWRVSQACGPVVAREGDNLRLNPKIGIDVVELAQICQTILATASTLNQRATDPILDDIVLLPSWSDTWLICERERLHLSRLYALEHAATHLASSHPARALIAALAAARTEPLRETAWRLVVRIYLTEGNVAEAWRVFDNYQALLRQELGVKPSELMINLIAPLARAGSR
jgi:DNA-binding SARP family transcriptional activator